MNSFTKEKWARQNNEYDTVINGVISTVRDTFLGNTVTVDENFLNNLKLIWESKLPLTHRKIDLEALEHETWPVEIWCKIFSYLPEESTKNASLACRRWLKIIREDPKLSGHKLVSWDKTLEISQDTNWNWFNWPSLKTIEISYETMPDKHVSIKTLGSSQFRPRKRIGRSLEQSFGFFGIHQTFIQKMFKSGKSDSYC